MLKEKEKVFVSRRTKNVPLAHVEVENENYNYIQVTECSKTMMVAKSCQPFGFHDLCGRMPMHRKCVSNNHAVFCLAAAYWAMRGISTHSKGHKIANILEEDDPVMLLNKVQKRCEKNVAPGERDQSTPRAQSERDTDRQKSREPSTIGSITRQGWCRADERGSKGESADVVCGQTSEHGAMPSGSSSNARMAPSKGATLSNAFLERLGQMEAARPSTTSTDRSGKEPRWLRVEKKVREERKRMLVFRNVGMELDRPILSRDIFLIPKYFYYGTEFAVDNELERMLRYFNEDALNELKVIQDSKLMRGPPTLAPRQKPGLRHTSSIFSVSSLYGHAESSIWPNQDTTARAFSDKTAKLDSASGVVSTKACGATSLPIMPTFPTISCANVRQFCREFDADVCQILRDSLRPNSSECVFCRFFPAANARGPTSSSRPKKFSENDSSLYTTLSAASFRKPALVIYSQLGQKFGSIADTMWRRLAYRTICPALLRYIPKTEDENTDADPIAVAKVSSLRRHNNSSAGEHRNMAINVVSVRSMDIYKYKWVHNLYVRRFAKFLSMPNPTSSTSKEGKIFGDNQDPYGQATMVNNALVSCTTFVGTKILEPFFRPFHLRNYMSPYAMLVDHDGVVRWISAGCPDAYEARHFPGLLNQLETEYLKSTHPR